jgi:broad specificity phosphatase PhoE
MRHGEVGYRRPDGRTAFSNRVSLTEEGVGQARFMRELLAQAPYDLGAHSIVPAFEALLLRGDWTTALLVGHGATNAVILAGVTRGGLAGLSAFEQDWPRRSSAQTSWTARSSDACSAP